MVLTTQEEEILKLMVAEKIAHMKVDAARAAEREKTIPLQTDFAIKHKALLDACQ